MAETTTRDDLLTVAMQDLRAGEDLLVERLPEVAACATDPDLAAELMSLVDAARARSLALRETGRGKGGAPNIWRAGVLRDAERDTRSVAAGVLLDIALVGAVRKGVAAALVSYETAMALAGGDLASLLTGCRDAHRAADARLAGVLALLA